MLDRLIDFLAGIIKNFQCWVIIYAYEGGVLMRFGRFVRVLGPTDGVWKTGLHFCIPFHIDHVLVENVVMRTVHLGAQSLTTKDGKSIVVSAIVTLCIKDIKVTLLEVESIQHAMMDACYGPICRHVDTKTWDELHVEDSFTGLTSKCKRQAKKYGIEIEKVELADLAVCRTYRMVNSDHPTRYEDPKVNVRL